jgi:urate oxidase
MPDNRPQFELDDASYGKDAVRVLVSVPRPHGADGVRDFSFSVRVWGPFDGSYRSGDNTEILPSDSLRRHLLQVATISPVQSPELICAVAATQIEQANPNLTAVLVQAHEQVWDPIADHSALAGLPARFGSARLNADGHAKIIGGVDDLQMMTTGGSDFTGFRRDRMTVQTEAVDRPLCGTLWARWFWLAGQEPTLAQSRAVAPELAAALADRPSNAIQQLVTVAGAELLERVAGIAEVRLRFAALPLVPVPSELAAAAGVRAHEVGSGPLGVTEVRVRRPPRP